MSPNTNLLEMPSLFETTIIPELTDLIETLRQHKTSSFLKFPSTLETPSLFETSSLLETPSFLETLSFL